jgi:hypothetical protein
MTCPICDQKPANCDCTEIERRQFAEIAELEEQVASLRLTDEERAAIESAADFIDSRSYASSDTLRLLLERTRPDA